MSRLFIAVIAAVAVLGVGCGENELTTSENAPLTVKEYAAIACPATAEDFTDGRTNGEVIERLQGLIDDLSDLKPPAELEEFHSANVQIAADSVAVLREMDEDDIFSPFSLLALGLGNMDKFERITGALSLETRVTLNNHGCEMDVSP